MAFGFQNISLNNIIYAAIAFSFYWIQVKCAHQ